MANQFESLRYRRQFFLGPKFLYSSFWHNTQIRPGILLSAHVDLPVEHVRQDHKSVTALGYLLVPYHPLKTNTEIVAGLLHGLVGGTDSIFELSSPLGGRWILIVDDGKSIEMFGDCFGMRTIFHVEGPSPCCASQVGLLREQLNLPCDPDALSYQEACLKAGQEEHWFPNTSSLCKNVKCLMPNHALNLITGNVTRSMSIQQAGKLPLREAITVGRNLMSGLFRAASARAKLTFLMSAGLDSRLALAAARGVKESLAGLSFISHALQPDDFDVVIPSKLLPKLGIPHKVIDCRSEMSAEFSEIYFNNTFPAHAAYGKLAFKIFNSTSQPFLPVVGSGAEALRPLGNEHDGVVLDAEYLTESFVPHPFARKEIGLWLDSVASVRGLTIEYLFYVEQRMARWCSEGYTEWDIVQDCFSPFNCRSLIETLKGVNLHYQREPECELFYALIRSLWPEVLLYPVNPHKKLPRKSRTLKHNLKIMLVKLHLLDYLPASLIAKGRDLLA